jgi:transposase-like protein
MFVKSSAAGWIVEDFRTRPLDGAPYAYVTFDALVVKCRDGGRTA